MIKKIYVKIVENYKNDINIEVKKYRDKKLRVTKQKQPKLRNQNRNNLIL